MERMDVETTFPQSPVSEDVYVKQTPGFSQVDPYSGKALVAKLKRSLYGLNQLPRNFNLTFQESLLEIGFKSTLSDSCVYTYGAKGTYAFMYLYVHDLSTTAASCALLEHIKHQLKGKFAKTEKGRENGAGDDHRLWL